MREGINAEAAIYVPKHGMQTVTRFVANKIGGPETFGNRVPVTLPRITMIDGPAS